MIHYIVKVLETIAVAGVMFGIGYYAVCLRSVASFLREQSVSKTQKRAIQLLTPPVSILKPLKGVDPQIYEALRSHCLQDYSEYEIIFGVSDANDPAVEVVQRLKKEFPERLIQIVVCHENLGANTKVSNLAQMLAVARHDYLVVNDSDIRVESDYLKTVISPLNNPEVGVVTCLYRGVAAPTLGSRLESLGISTDFCGGVLVARYVEGGLRFGFGSTLAFRRRDLLVIGGFECFVDYLADDYELASRIAARGLGVHLSDVIVESFLPPYSWRQFVDHQLRWARGVRDCRPFGYAGLLFTFALPWAVLAVATSSAALWVWGLLGITMLARLAVAWALGWCVLRDRQLFRWLWLIPVRDAVALLLWMASFVSRKVTWRGAHFYLRKGKLSELAPRITGKHLE